MKMLIAVDFSPVGREVAHYGYKLAKSLGMTPTFFHCTPTATHFLEGYEMRALLTSTNKPEVKNLQDIARQKLHKIMEDVISENSGEAPVKIEEQISYGDAAEEIINYAKNGEYEMIVIGYKSYSTLEMLLVGSTAAKVARYAPCSVLIYRPK